MATVYDMASSMLPGGGYVGGTPTAYTSPAQTLVNSPSPTVTDYQGNTTSTTINTGGGGYEAPYSTGGYTTQSAPVYVDPYAQWGGKAAYDSLVNGFNTQKQGVFTSAAEAGDSLASKYNRSILDFLDQNRLGQQQINSRANNNELAKVQGVRGILGMVGRGIRSAGVMLANKNASDSSAAGAIANAYGQIGRGELGNVGQQYEQGNQEVSDLQNTYNVQRQSGLRNLQGGRDDSVNQIVNETGLKLSELDARMQAASLPERIAIDQEKARIKAETLARLQQYDQQLSSGLQGITPTSVDARREAAANMARMGTSLGEDAFNYTTETPMQLQGGGLPGGSGLPIYTMPRSRRTG